MVGVGICTGRMQNLLVDISFMYSSFAPFYFFSVKQDFQAQLFHFSRRIKGCVWDVRRGGCGSSPLFQRNGRMLLVQAGWRRFRSLVGMWVLLADVNY